MKNLILAAMAVLTLSGSTAQANGWDYFWGTTISQGLDPKTNGWDDFWGQCQNENRTTGDCVGTIATGIGVVVVAPVVIVSAVVLAAAYIPVAGTVLAVTPLPIMVATPIGG